MNFETKVLAVVKSITDTSAYFFNGTLFVETTDSEVAVRVFNGLRKQVTAAIAFVKCGNETSYDFI